MRILHKLSSRYVYMLGLFLFLLFVCFTYIHMCLLKMFNGTDNVMETKKTESIH